jgi:general secretion pathway protein A
MGIGMLTGEIGSGKTMTRTVLERSISRHEYEVVGLDSHGLEFNDLLFDIIKNITFQHISFEISQFNLENRRDDLYYLLETFQKCLNHLYLVEKRHLVIIIDEAQQLNHHTLDQIKNLTNLGTENGKYLTVLFIGQPELRDTIMKLKQLDQRVSLRFHLNNLGLEDCLKYIQHRLRVAGCSREDLFTADSADALYRHTHGVPREINRVCKLALDYGSSIAAKEIDKDTVRMIIDDMLTQQ